MAEYLKGQIAEMMQVNPETLRFYEKMKLIPMPKRTKAGYRLYPEEVLYRLDFIKNAKASGFTLKQISEMFSLTEDQDYDINDLNNVINAKIEEIDSRISILEDMRASLVSFKNQGRKSMQCPHINAFLNRFNKIEE